MQQIPMRPDAEGKVSECEAVQPYKYLVAHRSYA